MKKMIFWSGFLLLSSFITKVGAQQNTIFHNANLIDGTGNSKEEVDILIKNNKIIKIEKNIVEPTAKYLDMSGKTIMPTLISDHVHIGNVKGIKSSRDFYTKEHIVYQLKKYLDFGIGNIMVMGTDRPYLFDSGIRDLSLKGQISGARIHTSAIGFGIPEGAPPLEMAMDQVFRPTSLDEISEQLKSILPYKPELVKFWLDDFNGTYKSKMPEKIYKTIINEAHNNKLRVAAHVFYLSDARKVVKDGVDILAHSIRDSIVDDNLLEEMKEKGVVYIPTLSLDEFAFIYSKKPEWINDPFFKASLEEDVYNLITSDEYQNKIKNDPQFNQKIKAFNIALINLKKIYDKGILVALGTDSGAMFLRAQGFSEHLELQLMTEAGLTPMQAIVIATKNAAKVIDIDDNFGTIEVGKTADFLILNSNPIINIKNTRDIYQVWKDGKKVSDGPIKNKNLN